jgi:carboxyl-terminal processing protease
MFKKIPLYSVIILIVLSMLVTFNATYLAISEKHNRQLEQLMGDYAKFDALLSVDAIVEQFYIGEAEIDNEELMAALIQGYLSAIQDPYSTYMTASEYEAYVTEQSGYLVGIGISVTYSAEADAIEIVNILAESPVEEAGLINGDFIVSVEGEAVADLGYYEALSRIRGSEGGTVRLTVRRDGTEWEITCERRKIKTQSVSHHVFETDPTVGVIRITEFNDITPEQFKDAVAELQARGCRKFVFDLRNNPGGELKSIVKVLDFLLPEGPLTHIYYKKGDDAHYESDEEFLDAPVAVLTNGRTASAAELFTAALKDYTVKGDYDATVVGTNTYGKGVLQRSFKLKDGSSFKISVGHYDPPYSENYDGKGIAPNLEIELSEEAQKINFNKLTDRNDNQLIAAVAVLANK